MTNTKVSVFGSCVSRDLFNGRFVADYNDYFDLTSDQQHVSIVSIMSDTIKKYESSLTIEGDVSSFYKNNFKRDLSKIYLKELQNNPPEFLILDFYTDAFYGTIEANNSYITNKLWQYKKLNVYSQLEIGREYSVYNNSLEFINLWKKNFDLFMNYLEEYCPNTKIIVNKARFVNKMKDPETNNVLKMTDVINDKWKEFHINRFNIIWDLFDTYAIEKYNLLSIDLDFEKYYGDKNHAWGTFYTHYNSEYYTDTFKSLVNIIREN